MNDVRDAFLVVIAIVLGFCFCISADEALVEVKSGDIIAVKPNGSVWGRMETDGKHYIIKKIEDKELKYDTESKLIIYPYAVTSNETVIAKGETNITSHMIAISKYRVDPKADDSKAPLVKDSPSFTNVMKSVAITAPKEEPVDEKPGEVVK